MSPKQKKIAAKAPPPDKIDGKDFAVLKAEKAKGRGMGLQDESIKPGKVMKANKGKMTPIKKDPTTPVNPFEKRRKQLGGGRSKLPGRIGTALGIGAMMVPAAYAAAKQYKDYKSAKNRDEAKVKKMGGGMMQRPMGYTSGGDAKKSKPASPQKKPENKYNSGPDLRPDPDILGNRYQKKVEKYYGSKEAELHAGYKNDKRPFPDLGEDIAEKRAMKEVLQEAGIKFKTGGSVMARGCKLGRTKKTKLY